MRRLTLMIAAAGAVAVVATGCSRETGTNETAVEDAPVAEAIAAPGQSTGASVLTYDGTDNGIPVRARYPNLVEVSGFGSGEGVAVFFEFKPRGDALDGSEVHLFLPAGGSSASDITPFVTGPGGVIESNGWSLEGSRSDGVTEFSYPWFETVFDVTTDTGQSGHILLGQTAGQAVQVTLLYPAEMADEYWGIAKPILESLEFEPDLLPIRSSGL